ncbi:MAG: tRNA 2-selenouridine(34) synthase MnmH [Planctomycetota bacterium]
MATDEPQLSHARGEAPPAAGMERMGLGVPAGDEIQWEQVAGAAAVLVDVRAPGEYAEDHIPGSISLPLFDDEERVQVGTLYQQEGPAAARRWGACRIRGRLEQYTDALLSAFELPVDGGGQGLPRVVVCARGGQRSGAVTEHLRSLGFAVQRLSGGYRAYRSAVRKRLERLVVPGPIVLNGLTGCGKTRVLRELEKLRPGHIVDLEGIAGHRSSVLGDIGLRPVSQKEFEAELMRRVERLAGGWTMIEWEARRVGNRELPNRLYQQMHAATQIELRATIDQRVAILADEYLECGGVEEVSRRLPALARYPAFGQAGVAAMQQSLAAGEIGRVVRELLDRHYDPRYQHGNRDFDFTASFDLADAATTAREILAWIESR